MLTARTCSHHMILTRITWSSRDACGRAWLFCSPDDSMTWPSGRRYATSLACVSFLTARQVGYRFSSVGLFSGHTDALHIPGVCVFSDRTTGPWRFTSVGVFSDHTDTLQIPGVCVFSDRTTGPWPFHLRGCLFWLQAWDAMSCATKTMCWCCRIFDTYIFIDICICIYIYIYISSMHIHIQIDNDMGWCVISGWFLYNGN